MCKRVLVTGANGFVGQHLCRRLLEMRKEVSACIREEADSSVFGNAADSLRIQRIPSLGSGADLSKVSLDVDAVIHLAGRVHIMRDDAADPLDEFRKVNVGGTESLALMASRKGVKRFIYVSSIKVNGEATYGRPFCADDPPGFSDPYGQSKWEAEEGLRKIAAKANMEWVVVRPPLVYGPGVRGNFLTLLKCVLRGIPLPVGSLKNRRSLVSVYNLSEFLCLLLDRPAAANSRFVVGDAEDISTPDLIRRMAGALQCSARVVRCPETVLHLAGTLLGKNAAVQRLCSSLVIDREKTSKYLDWSAPMTIDWTLDRTAEWFLGKRLRL